MSPQHLRAKKFLENFLRHSAVSLQIPFCWCTQGSSGWTLCVAQARLWCKCSLHAPANLQTNGMEILKKPLFLNSSGMKFYTKFKRFVFWHLFHTHQVKHLICRAAACVIPTRVLCFPLITWCRSTILSEGGWKSHGKVFMSLFAKCFFQTYESLRMSRRATSWLWSIADCSANGMAPDNEPE